MPKIKTSRAAAKRFKVTGTGKLKRNKAYKSHILTKKSTKRKRNLRKATVTDATNVKNMKKILWKKNRAIPVHKGSHNFENVEMAPMNNKIKMKLYDEELDR